MAPQSVLVTGFSGPIGAALLPSLRGRGYEITRMVRRSPHSAGEIEWDPAKEVSPESVSGFDAVIHLAGESIARRWTAEKKRKIRDSRVQGTSHLSQALIRAPKPPRVFICSSAIGYYGSRGDTLLRENSTPGSGFLPEVCQEWEAAAHVVAAAGVRTVLLRTGIVLSAAGGALPAMLPPFRFGLGGRIGSGRQWWSWIDVQDMAGAIQHILKTDLLQGPVNMVAPRPVTNAEFTAVLASVLSRPALFPLPAFAAKLLLGEMAEELLLASQRVEPARLVASGYPFQYIELRKSLESQLRK
jgi:uncharacterized protein (TIGR01777 family)